MNRRDAETQRKISIEQEAKTAMSFGKAIEDKVTERVIGCAIEVHRALGPGLLESAYEECLCYELSQAGLEFERQVDLPVIYKGVRLDCGYRMDLVVKNLVVVEIKAVERLLPIHEAQLLSYLKLYDKSVGLLLNFHTSILKNGLKRIVNNFQNPSASPRLGGENFLKV